MAASRLVLASGARVQLTVLSRITCARTARWRRRARTAPRRCRAADRRTSAQVAVANYRPDWWPTATGCLIRRVRLTPEQVPADPRSRRRRTLHPDQRALPIPELVEADTIYAYSFIVTNLDMSAKETAVAVEHWYRHRTSIENVFFLLGFSKNCGSVKLMV
jgi:hypothetical protein